MSASGDPVELEPRGILLSMARGFRMRCPHCGKGKLFRGFLKSVDRCDRCGEEYSHHRADDLPPYLTVFIVGHIVVALFMGAETWADLSLAAHLAIWIPVTLVLSLVLLQPLKGATIGLQWAIRMHGFGGAPAEADH
ncbi:DUF983 domain-containing protein [Aureimonas phyllosphaerae]|uniref:Uncharacterized protein (DUF983 family) n=1 Tax=Aureimonas phyllosphaerae TaxID=1166078 RepID=A0A7W6BR33_9HYPH|nr:DUF983 domain-containing protein [Aureimonas phyllosphaerae]MBB3935347.1 uncharacterized protein (DUF983 family) [Aureimonas phyllosphaerae]MBB3959355.1 uncharacterized protein (DUF983 family) [Aureimonas phyllosphaerae]SFF04219.1 Uncharacterized conserved protein, DUF983 family [Aureimonas phyllosphaerae]